MEVVKISTKMQGEVLSEKESQLMVMKKEMQNLQKLNKSLTKQYAELKCEKIALDTKVKNVSTCMYASERYSHIHTLNV